jgi:8-oxo-dGTP pyrophosphatase MutT (NUDIX family)
VSALAFDPSRPPATPTPAASVLVVRDTPDGLAVYCIVRSKGSGFLGGALAFPGGKLDPSDAVEGASIALGHADERLRALSGELEPRALVVAAARELLEEASLLPTRRAVAPSALASLAAEARRKGAPPLASLLEAHDLELDVDAFVPFGRWVTPEAEPRRFDARFFLVVAPPGQDGSVDAHEATHGFWSTPREVLAREARGELFAAPPTERMLSLLVGVSDTAGASSLAAEQRLEPICPRFVAADPPYLALPGDPSHELAERVVRGPTRYVLEGTRFVPRDP